jgi:signal transduction histidine kinase
VCVDINEIATAIFRLFGRQLADSNIDVSFELHPEPLWTRADAVRMEQVILNLISNASRAFEEVGDARPHRISVRTRPSVENILSPRRTVIIEVEDNGAGIPREIRDRIFEPFFTTSRPGGGTGLGLSVSRRIIEEHGGTIRVHSEVGVGTRFELVLPCHDE